MPGSNHHYSSCCQRLLPILLIKMLGNEMPSRLQHVILRVANSQAIYKLLIGWEKHLEWFLFFIIFFGCRPSPCRPSRSSNVKWLTALAILKQHCFRNESVELFFAFSLILLMNGNKETILFQRWLYASDAGAGKKRRTEPLRERFWWMAERSSYFPQKLFHIKWYGIV